MNIKVILFFIITISYFFLPDNSVGKKKLINISCFFLALESGLRGLSVGPDTMGYYMSYWETVRASWADVFSALFVDSSEFRDPGYGIYVKLTSIIYPSWQFFLLLNALILYLSLGLLWNRYLTTKQSVLFASILWLTLFDIIALSGIRQMITTAIAFYVIPFVEDRNWKVVIPSIILGSLIHISLLFFAAFIPLSMINESYYKRLLFIAIALVPIIGAFSSSIMAWMTTFMANDYYKEYAEESTEAKGYTYVFLCTTLSLFVLVYYKYLKSAPKFYMIAAIMMTVLVPLILRGGTAIRIGQYYTVYMMLSLPYIIEKHPQKRGLYSIMLGILIFYIFYYSSANYAFFWNDSLGYIYGL